jgi:biopolymer transport protein ExbB
MTHSGLIGILIWLGLFGCSAITIGLAIDSFINIREKKIAPQKLVEDVRAAMEQGDVVKAIQHCEQQPGPLANILKAGFSNVQEGYEVVQDAVGVATDLESEKMLQKVGILNAMFNLGPMVGLIGTVQGMINAFGNLATTAAGAAQQAMLALSISESLWATAAGLIVAVIALSFYQYFRNITIKLNLSMEGMTLDLIKSLKNVEVVTEE